MGIKLEANDQKYVNQLYNVITKAISGMPHELMKSSRFGAWSITALVNILCSMSKLMNLDKETLHKIIDDIWDNQNSYDVLN